MMKVEWSVWGMWEATDILGTFRAEDEDDYEYEFSVTSTRNSKNVGL